MAEFLNLEGGGSRHTTEKKCCCSGHQKISEIVVFWSLLVVACVAGFASAFVITFTLRKPPTIPTSPEEFYTVAAMQMERLPSDPTVSIRTEVRRNLQQYDVELTKAVANNPDLEMVVFPEGANGWFPDQPRWNRSTSHLFGDNIPFVLNGAPVYNPCDDESRDVETSQLKFLACLARKHQVYLVANLIEVRSCPSMSSSTFQIGDPTCGGESSSSMFHDQTLQFNTAVAFSKDGQLLTAYNKRHISGTFGVLNEPTPSRQPRFFDATFTKGGGDTMMTTTTTKKKTTVRFGLLICQDLTHVDVLNEYRALGIRDIILSTHYSNLAPVYKMGMAFQGYSLAYDINFIASNGISSSSNGGGLFTRGRAAGYFYDLASKTNVVPVVGRLPILQPNTVGATKTNEDLALHVTKTPEKPDTPTCSVISALGFVKGPCKLVDVQPGTSGTVSVYQGPEVPNGVVNQFGAGSSTDLLCDLEYSVSKESAGSGGVAEKYALVAWTMSYADATSCEGITFNICMLVACPKFPDCAGSIPTETKTTFSNIALTASGLAAGKTLMLPNAWGQGAMPLLAKYQDDVAYDASPFQFERTLLGDVVKYSTSKKFVPQAIPAVVLGANTPFGNICWKE